MLGDTSEDPIDNNMMLSVQVESGKININSLYDFANKKFVNEGSDSGDRKKLCEWLFDKIGQVQGGSSLFQPFANYLSNRKYPLNDVTELLSISEFSESFDDAIYYAPGSTSNADKKLCLTDLFTVVSETDTLQPWVLSPSLILLLGGNVGLVSADTLQDVLQKFSAQTDWSQSWDETIKNLYGIKFDNLSEEMKSILTSQFEATIFSISLNVHDQKGKADLYALLKEKNRRKWIEYV